MKDLYTQINEHTTTSRQQYTPSKTITPYYNMFGTSVTDYCCKYEEIYLWMEVYAGNSLCFARDLPPPTHTNTPEIQSV